MNDPDLFDILMVHEDGYTNLLQYLFERNGHFRRAFTKLLFGEENAPSLRFITRTAYLSESGAAKKSVPDIIVCDKDHFCIVEVKVSASEGDRQTERYYNVREKIKTELGVCGEPVNEKYYFLSLDPNARPSDEHFEPLGWKKIGDCLPKVSEIGDQESLLIKLLIAQLAERIRTIGGEDFSPDGSWPETVTAEKWAGATRFRRAIGESDLFAETYGLEHWDTFNKKDNKYMLSVRTAPRKDWTGCSLDDVIKGAAPAKCCSLHFEFEWDPVNMILKYRLDYELNPYLSKKETEMIADEAERSAALACGDVRAGIARYCKDIWKDRYAGSLPQDLSVSYNGRITKYLLVLISGAFRVEAGQTVREVTEKLRPFVETASEFVNKEILPEIKRRGQKSD